MRWAFLAVFLTLGTTAFTEPVTITGYLIGSPPRGLQEVLDEVNRRLDRDLGARLELNYIGWNELNSKYGLVLAGGDGVDWIFTADWAPYSTQAVRGAFRALTSAELQKNMPRHWAATPAAAWDQAKVAGQIFMVPTATPDRKVPVALVRGDLRKAAGLAPLRSVEDLEPYLAAVKAAPGAPVPMALGSGYDIGQPFMALLNPSIPPVLASFFGTLYGNYESRDRRLVDLLSPEYRPAFVKAAVTMKRWYDRGYLNRAPFANLVHSKDAFAAGKSAVGFGNSQDVQALMAAAQARGYDPEIVPILSSTGHSPADAWTGNGVALAASGQHPDLTLKVLDLLMEDQAYVRLLALGLEGKTYRVTGTGEIDLPAGLKAEDNPYPADAAGFWFVNKTKIPNWANWTLAYRAHREALGGYLVPNSFQGFTYSPWKVKNEIAQITTVMDQYWAPLAIGAVADPEKAVRALEAKLKAAGFDKARADLEAQLAPR